MSLRKLLSRPLEKLGHRFVRGKRRPDGSVGDVVGEGVEPADFPPQPESDIAVGGEYGQGGSEGGRGQGSVGSVDSPLQPDDPEAVAPDEHEPELGQNKIDVDEGEVELADSSPHLGDEEVLGSIGGREGGEAVVEAEIGPTDPSPQPNVGISDDRESSDGT